MVMERDKDDDTLYKALRYSEILGEDLFHILQLEDKAFDDFVFCCEQRIREEMRRRIETGIITPFKYLKWTSVGNDNWKFINDEEVPF